MAPRDQQPGTGDPFQEGAQNPLPAVRTPFEAGNAGSDVPMIQEAVKNDIIQRQAQSDFYHKHASDLNGLLYHINDPALRDAAGRSTVVNPETGKPYTDAEIAQVQAQREYAEEQWEKSVGAFGKGAKGAAQKARSIIDFLHGRRGGIQQPPTPNYPTTVSDAGVSTASGGTITPNYATNVSDAGVSYDPRRAGGMPPPPAAPLTRYDVARASLQMPFATHGAKVQQGITDEQARYQADIDMRKRLAPQIGLKEGTREYNQWIATGGFPNISRAGIIPKKLTSQILGGELGSDVDMLGEEVDPNKRYDVFYSQELGKFAMPAGYLGGEAPNTPWKAFKKSREDKGMPLDKIVDDYNTHYSSTTGTRIIRDADNNYVEVPVTSGKTEIRGTPVSNAPVSVTAPQGSTANAPSGSTKTSGRGASIQSPPLPRGGGAGRARPIVSAGGEQVHAPLSQAAKTGLFQIRSTEGMIDQVRPELEAVVSDIGRGGNIWDSAQQRSAWEQYTKLGLDPSNIDPSSVATLMPNVDPRLAKMLPTIAMLQVLGAQPYLRSVRRFEFVKQIQQHLPDPEKDTPQLMLEKLNQLQKNLPGLEKALMESEGIKGTSAGGATKPGEGKTKKKEPEYF